MNLIGPLAAEIGPVVCGTLANFNGFRVLASLLQWRRSTEANQTLHDVWPLPELVDYIYTFGGCCPVTEFWQVQNSLCALQVLRSPIGSVTARHSSSGREPNFAGLSTGRHLYWAGWPSRWALAHILALFLLDRIAALARRSSVVCLSLTVSPAKAAELIVMLFMMLTRVEQRTIYGVHVKEQFWGRKRADPWRARTYPTVDTLKATQYRPTPVRCRLGCAR